MKRIFDFTCSSIGLTLLSPVILVFMFLVWLQDKHSPFYVANRVGMNGRLFRMVKLRSMVINADKSGVDSTSSSDNRITPLGMIIRKFKIDEITQLWNVVKGDMSLVGPRPNVERDVSLYTHEENRLLEVRPGITDFSSIVFSDEGDILSGSDDPDLKYNQVIRPWKSRLGLIYVDKNNVMLDFMLILLTLLALVSKRYALDAMAYILDGYSVENQIIRVSLRNNDLDPYPPPGSTEIVSSR